MEHGQRGDSCQGHAKNVLWCGKIMKVFHYFQKVALDIKNKDRFKRTRGRSSPAALCGHRGSTPRSDLQVAGRISQLS